MKRLIENIVFSGFVIAWRFAGSPTLRSPPSTNATIEGVVLLPSLFAITTGSLPSSTATQELVVPKSIPIIFPIIFYYFNCYYFPVFAFLFRAALTVLQIVCQSNKDRFVKVQVAGSVTIRQFRHLPSCERYDGLCMKCYRPLLFYSS